MVDIDKGRKERYQVDPSTIVGRDLKLIKESVGVVAVVDGALSYGRCSQKDNLPFNG